MAFSFFRWLFNKNEPPQPVTSAEFFDLCADLYIRELAFLSCVNLTANAISKCEFKTFSEKTETKKDEYYLWNISPNQNQNSSTFLHKLIYQLYLNNEALVVENGGRLFVADSFSRKEYALYDDVFSQVTVGDFQFSRTFLSSDVLYFQLSAEKMRTITNGLYASYSKLIAYGMKSYQKSRGTKGTLEIEAQMANDEKFTEAYNAIKNQGFRKFAEADSAVMPLYKGMKYDGLNAKTYSSDTTRDIRAMIDDVTDFTARAFSIPPQLLNGSVQDVDSVTDEFLTFCIDPLADNLSEEINRKRYSKSEFLRGSCLQIDTRCIKHVDLLNSATAVDKLIGSGCFCVNDLRKLTGDTEINEDWAQRHFITKNYTDIAELQSLEGSEKD